MRKELGKKLRELRERAGLSAEEAAHSLGITRSSLGMYEQGRRMPSLDMLKRIADLYMTDVNTIAESVSDGTSIGKLEMELSRLSSRREKLLREVTENPTNLKLVKELEEITKKMIGLQADLARRSKPRRPTRLVPVISTLKSVVEQVKAGLLKFATEDILEYVPVRADLNIDYVLLVEGDSLIDVGIEPGDRLLVRKTDVTKHGDLVIAMVGDDGEATVKYFVKEGGKYFLRAANDKYEDREFNPEVDRIIGIVVRIEKNVPPPPQ